jgi:hypothetical protein
MKWFELALFASSIATADPSRVVLLQETVRVEAMARKQVLLFPLEQQDAQLEIRFVSRRGGEGVKLAVYEINSNIALAGTVYEVNGALRTALVRQHQFRVEIENLRQRLGHALVDVEVSLVFGSGHSEPPPASAARTLDPRRRLYTIIASLSLFAMILAYSALRLTPPILDRWRDPR